ncbi:MAG: hypothetical protein A2X23_12945 [Chloroflexi bacterium GWC2_73_18]|nr:MAG: hypothetical protein A2X23_12945 [Chloroflexi bacterium GWC2_73_18]
MTLDAGGATAAPGSRPRSPRRLPAVLAAAWLALICLAAGPAARPALADCAQLELSQLQRTPDLVVFAGAVRELTDPGARLRVQAWFVGDDPRDQLLVVGGAPSEPGVVTEDTWSPKLGAAYLIVGQRSDTETVETVPCQQRSADGTTLNEATVAFGKPRVPPFPTLEPRPAPGSGPFGRAPGELAVAAAFALVGGAAGLLVVTRLQRRGG